MNFFKNEYSFEDELLFAISKTTLYLFAKNLIASKNVNF